MPELQKLLHSVKMTLDNSANPPKNLILNSGLFAILPIYKWLIIMSLPLPRRLCFCQTLFVRLCVSKITQKVMDGFFWNFSGNVRNGRNYQWFNFGGDPEGILDSGSLWNFPYYCFQWSIRETADKPKMVLPPSKQHGLGGGVQALTAF